MSNQTKTILPQPIQSGDFYLRAILQELWVTNATLAAIQQQLQAMATGAGKTEPAGEIDLREPIAESSTNPPPSPKRRTRRS